METTIAEGAERMNIRKENLQQMAAQKWEQTH